MSALHDLELADAIRAERLRRGRRLRLIPPPDCSDTPTAQIDWPQEVSDHPSFPKVAGSICRFSGLTDEERIAQVAGVLRMVDEADRRSA